MNESGPRAGIDRGRILVGVDGSEDGLRAVTYASTEALVTGGDVWIVHAIDDAAPITGLWDIVSSPEVRRHAADNIVAEATAVATGLGLPSGRVAGEIVDGRPSDVLTALSYEAGLLVLGRRSLRGLERLFVGSTSLAAAVRAACPVIVISAASTPQRTGALHSVAVAVSTWPVHERALEWGLREAAIREAGLRVLHVVPETLGVEGAEFVTVARAGLEDLLAPFRSQHPGVPVEADVLLGDPVAALVGATTSVDLMILGVHHDRANLGGAIRAVIAHAHCPVGLIK